jgi:hypothetical protein
LIQSSALSGCHAFWELKQKRVLKENLKLNFLHLSKLFEKWQMKWNMTLFIWLTKTIQWMRKIRNSSKSKCKMRIKNNLMRSWMPANLWVWITQN